MIAPLLDQLADEYEGRAKIVKVDIQEHQKLGMRFNARSIPMLLTFKDGQVHGTQIGAVGKPQLAQLIDKAALIRATPAMRACARVAAPIRRPGGHECRGPRRLPQRLSRC